MRSKRAAPRGCATPGRCLTWGPAAAIWAAASARDARAQLASTTNPEGSPGAGSTRAAFTDVVPRSTPRMTDRAAIACESDAANASKGHTADVRVVAPPPAHSTRLQGSEAGPRLPILQPHPTWRPLAFPLVKESGSSRQVLTIGGEGWKAGSREPGPARQQLQGSQRCLDLVYRTSAGFAERSWAL